MNNRIRFAHLCMAMAGAVLLIGLNSCGKQQTEKDKQTTSKVTEVTVETVQQETVQATESFSANLEAYVKNNISPQSPNRISHISVEVGQQVAQGQLLVTLNQEALTQTKLQLENRKAEYERLKKLYEVGGISKRDWEAQQTALEVNQSAYRNLSQNTMLRSPISGIVTARNYDDGDMVSPALPILVVQKIAPLKMKVSVSENFFSRFKKGNSVEVSLDIFPEETFNGKVALTYPTIDPRTRTFDAEVELPNKDKRLHPGMFARAKVDLGTEEVCLVPDLAVQTLPGTNDRYVFVVKGQHVEQRSIELGKRYGNKFNVLKGLEAGEIVVTSGFTGLRDGDEVKSKP